MGSRTRARHIERVALGVADLIQFSFIGHGLEAITKLGFVADLFLNLGKADALNS
jgi:hypothetical protein